MDPWYHPVWLKFSPLIPEKNITGSRDNARDCGSDYQPSSGLPLSGSGGNFIRNLPGGRFSPRTRFPVGFTRVTFLRRCLLAVLYRAERKKRMEGGKPWRTVGEKMWSEIQSRLHLLGFRISSPRILQEPVMQNKSGTFSPRKFFSSIFSKINSPHEIEMDAYRIKFIRWQADGNGFKEWTLDSVEYGLEGTLKLSADAVRSEDGVLTGEMVSPVLDAGFDIATAVPSWNVDAPPGSWIKTFLRVKIKETWSKWYTLGIWSQSDDPAERHSVKGQEDANAEVATDTLVLKEGVKADALQMKFQLNSRSDSQYPVINGAALVMNNRQAKNLSLSRGDSSLWNKILPIPQYSQMGYPDGGKAWCSPTSVAMVLAFWQDYKGLPESMVHDAVKGVFDSDYNGTGNWPFNTAYVATKGMTAAVSRLANLEEAERFIAAGIPLVMGISWKAGDLTGAPIEESEGHLVVLAGFDAAGNPVVNDPAGENDEQVQRVYHRDELEKLWRKASGGMVYIITPMGITWPE